MKKHTLIISLLLSANFLFAQEAAKDTTIGTATEKQQFAAMNKLLESKSFVLEAKKVQNEHGNQYLVNTNLNFLIVEANSSTIQIGSDAGIGPNGVGGITLKGTISNWKFTTDEARGSFSIHLTVTTPESVNEIFIDVSSFGNAKATVSGNKIRKFTYIGKLVSLNDSKVYVGTHL